MRRPVLFFNSEFPYRGDAYRLWFHFLRLARMDQRPQVQDALARSASFYAPWGDIRSARFFAWWKDHKYLFKDKYAVRKLAVGEPPSDPDALIVEIPLRRSQSVLIQKVTDLIREEMEERPQQPSGKSRNASTAEFRLTEGAEPKLRALWDMLHVYYVHLRHPEAHGKKLLNEVQALWKLDDTKGSVENRLRNLNRYIAKAEQVILNVASGEFPGTY